MGNLSPRLSWMHILMSAHTTRAAGMKPSETTNKAIVEIMDRLGINCIVTASHPIIMGMMQLANETTLSAINEYPGRIYGYISVCPGEGLGAVKSELKKYALNPGFVGLKFLPGVITARLPSVNTSTRRTLQMKWPVWFLSHMGGQPADIRSKRNGRQPPWHEIAVRTPGRRRSSTHIN